MIAQLSLVRARALSSEDSGVKPRLGASDVRDSLRTQLWPVPLSAAIAAVGMSPPAKERLLRESGAVAEASAGSWLLA